MPIPQERQRLEQSRNEDLFEGIADEPLKKHLRTFEETLLTYGWPMPASDIRTTEIPSFLEMTASGYDLFSQDMQDAGFIKGQLIREPRISQGFSDYSMRIMAALRHVSRRMPRFRTRGNSPEVLSELGAQTVKALGESPLRMKLPSYDPAILDALQPLLDPEEDRRPKLAPTTSSSAIAMPVEKPILEETRIPWYKDPLTDVDVGLRDRLFQARTYERDQRTLYPLLLDDLPRHLMRATGLDRWAVKAVISQAVDLSLVRLFPSYIKGQEFPGVRKEGFFALVALAYEYASHRQEGTNEQPSGEQLVVGAREKLGSHYLASEIHDPTVVIVEKPVVTIMPERYGILPEEGLRGYMEHFGELVTEMAASGAILFPLGTSDVESILSRMMKEERPSVIARVRREVLRHMTKEEPDQGSAMKYSLSDIEAMVAIAYHIGGSDEQGDLGDAVRRNLGNHEIAQRITSSSEIPSRPISRKGLTPQKLETDQAVLGGWDTSRLHRAELSLRDGSLVGMPFRVEQIVLFTSAFLRDTLMNYDPSVRAGSPQEVLRAIQDCIFALNNNRSDAFPNPTLYVIFEKINEYLSRTRSLPSTE